LGDRLNTLLPLIIAGLVTGSVYSLGGVGLVLTYKSTRIFNFAYGAFATVGAYAFYFLNAQEHIPWPLAAFLSIIVVGVLLGIGFEPIARVLERRSLVEQVAATIGILLAVQGICTIIYGQESRIFPAFLPSASFRLLGTNINVTDAVTMGLVLLAAAGLFVFFRHTRLGVALRGIVDSPDLLDLAGTSPRNVRRWAWIIGSVFATLSGVLLAPSLQLDATTLSLLVVNSFGAAAIGAFTNLPLTYVGGLAIGVAGSIIENYSNSTSLIVAGIAPSLPFIALFLVTLIINRRRIPPHKRIPVQRTQWTAPPRLQLAAALVVLLAACFVPQLVGSTNLVQWTQVLIYVILFLSLGFLVRRAGEVSLCQMTFAAIGAAAFGHLAGSGGLGIPWPVALVLAGLAVVPVGLVLAIPAIRVGGLYLALATFGFAIVVQGMFYDSSIMFGVGGLSEPAPSLSWINLSSPTGLYYVVLFVTVCCASIIVLLDRSRFGRLLSAMSDSPVALSTSGANVTVTKAMAFAISAFFAGIAGALLGVNVTLPTGDVFNPTSSLELLAVVLIMTGGAPWYALLAAAGLVIIPIYVTSQNVNYYLQVFFGVNIVLLVIQGRPGVNAKVAAFLDRIGGRARARAEPQAATAQPAITPSGYLATRERDPANGLRVENLRVAFGGLVAVDDISLRAPAGQITGLIGPNGAGKTTTFNACSGLVRPAHGSVYLDTRDLTARGVAARAQLGLGRTFQLIELFDSLTVAENVALGREAAIAGASPRKQLVAGRGDHQAIARSAANALELCGIEKLAASPVVSLPTGQRRLVELARALAGPFRIVLLDEPSSGLDRPETAEFGTILRRVVQERGIGLLLVEHDMSLVMDVCDYIYVLDFGDLLFQGSCAEVSSSELVQAAYLGSGQKDKGVLT
jgi:ABC-type branched-subunit amino acid transport system ATPase component/branched-subunit amino acid ABC-type transport system permease component